MRRNWARRPANSGASGAGRKRQPGAAASFVCAVCAGRPCACDVAELAGLLRDAAQFPLAGGAVLRDIDEHPALRDAPFGVLVEGEEYLRISRRRAKRAKRAYVCAVCADRPCACDVAVLAEVLRDAAQLPRAAGVAIVGVRAVNKGERASD